MKDCCRKFTKWADLGWIDWSTLDGTWQIILSDSGSCSYDIPIEYCPFCGKKLERGENNG